MSECTLSGNYFDDDGCWTLRTKVVTARKPHICEECRRKINKGEQYEIHNYVYDGSIYLDKTCMDCLSLRKSFYPLGGWQTGNLKDEIAEHIVYELNGEVDEKCIVPLTPAAKDFIFGVMEEVEEA